MFALCTIPKKTVTKLSVLGAVLFDKRQSIYDLKKIDSFDKITPILTVYDVEHNPNDNITGSWTLKMFGGVKKANISDGAYIFEYELTDIYGLKRRGTAVKANAGGGNIRFE